MSIAAPILYHTFRAKRNVRPEQKADNSVITLNPLKSVLTYDAHIIPHRMTIAKGIVAKSNYHFREVRKMV